MNYPHFSGKGLLRASGTVVLLTVSAGAWANGCQNQSLSLSYPCTFGANGTGIARATFTNPNINTGVALGSIAGATFGAPAQTSGLQTERLAFDGQTGAAAASGSGRFNAWAALGQNNVGSSFNPTRSDGRVNLTMVGLDYTYANNVVAGIAATWDRTRIGLPSLNSGSLNGSGYNVAPYVSVPLSRNWLFDASVGFGRNDISIQDNNPTPAVSGSTNSKRMFTSVAVSYATTAGRTTWSGKLNWVTNEDKFAAFTLAPAVTGGPVAASTLRVSQLRLGGQVAYSAGMFSPYVGVTYVRDLQSPDAVVLAGQTPANDKDGFVVALGVNIFSRGAVSGGLSYTTETGRQQVKNDMFMANLAIRF